MQTIDRPIFILGPPRSGTSVLYKTFCTHPEVGFLHHATKRWPEWPRTGEHSRCRGAHVGVHPATEHRSPPFGTERCAR